MRSRLAIAALSLAAFVAAGLMLVRPLRHDAPALATSRPAGPASPLPFTRLPEAPPAAIENGTSDEAAASAFRRLQLARTDSDRLETLRDEVLALATQHALALPSGTSRHDALIVIAEAIARLDPHAAVAWASALGDATGKHHAFARIAGYLARIDPASAVALVAAMPPDLVRDRTIALVANIWARDDLAAALAWVSQLPQGPARAHGLHDVAHRWAESAPRPALAFVLSQPASPHQLDLLSSLTETWAGAEPDAALQWAQGIVDPHARLVALAAIIPGLANRTPEDAAALAAALPGGTEQSQLVQLVAGRWSAQDRLAASAWVETLSSPQLRTLGRQAIAPR